jgi:hypothetical protein
VLRFTLRLVLSRTAALRFIGNADFPIGSFADDSQRYTGSRLQEAPYGADPFSRVLRKGIVARKGAFE